MHDPFDDLMVRARCPECRITYRVRVQRLLFAAPIKCPVCHTETSFFVARHGVAEEMHHYVRYVEGRTRHPHFYLAL